MFEQFTESVPVALRLISCWALLAWALPADLASAQPMTKTFTVPAEASELEVTNQSGAIKVAVGAHASRITVTARQTGDAQITAAQPSSQQVKIEVTGRGNVELDIVVPAKSKLDLLCYKCAITVANSAGPVRARVTEGNIVLTNLRSPRVEAHSHNGNVSFTGEVLPSGSYTLKSFSGRVAATLPANADFRLVASSFKGGMDLGGFQMKVDKQSDKLVEASNGSGRAAVELWTQEGNISLHRKP